MHGHVLVALLEAVVLADVVQVVAADDDGSLHLHLEHDARQDAPADGHVPRERALLVDVRALVRLKTTTLVKFMLAMETSVFGLGVNCITCKSSPDSQWGQSLHVPS